MPRPRESSANLSVHARVTPASRGHTAALVALYVGVFVLGMALRESGAPVTAPRVSGGRLVAVYLPMLVVQWALVVYVSRVGRVRGTLRAMFGRGWSSASRALADVVLAAGVWLLILTTERVWLRLFASGTAPAVAALLPQGVPERLTWAVVAASVGFCEEVIFRGYFQSQFEAFWRRPALAIAAQAVLFGVAHGEHGAAAIVKATLYGLGFGALARWRRSLAPCVLCHAWTDLASGLLRG